MENSESIGNPTIVNSDLLELSPMRLPHPILKPSQKDNLIMLQTPVQKNLKVSFLTPKRTPFKEHNILQEKGYIAAQVRPHLLTDTSSSKGARDKETYRQTSVPTLVKTPNTLKGLKSSLTRQSSTEASDKSADSKWESLRQLDENSRWRDRVEVITKLDHEENTKCAQQVINEVISRAVDIGESKASEKKYSTALGSNRNSVRPVVNVGCNEKKSEEKLLKPRHNTYDVTSPRLNIPSGHGPVISPEMSSVPVTINSSQYALTDSCSLENVLPCEPVSNVVSATMKSARSFSDSIDTPVNKVHSKASQHSVDLNQIKFDFDPISTCVDEKNSPSQSNKKHPQEALNHSVFSPANATAVGSQPPEFALRAVDSIFGDSDFVDSANLIDQGHLDLDYLEKKTSGTISADLQKESLYVRFDPLLEGLSKRQSIALLGRKSDIIDFCGRVTPIPEETAEDRFTHAEREPDLLCDSPPRIAQEDNVVNNNLPGIKEESSGSGSGELFADDHTDHKSSDNGIIEVLKYTDADLQRALQKRKDRWLKEKNSFEESHQLREKKIRHLKVIKQDLVQRCENEVNRQLIEKTEIEEHMTHQKGELQMANTSAKELTDKMSSLFRKMEILQNVAENRKSNEKKLREISAEMQKKRTLAEEKMKELEDTAAERMKKISSEKSSVEADYAAQMNKLKLKMRAAELRAESLQTALSMKQKEKEELLKICDELVASNERGS